jgi:hypothetical protein
MAWEAVCTLLVSTMRFALTLALPYLLALGAIEACFAVLSRVNAKFPAYVAALPFKSVTLLLLVALTLPRLLDAASDIAAERTAQLQRLLDEHAASPPTIDSEWREPPSASTATDASAVVGARSSVQTTEQSDASDASDATTR